MQNKPGGVCRQQVDQVYNALNTPINAKAFLARYYADSIRVYYLSGYYPC